MLKKEWTIPQSETIKKTIGSFSIAEKVIFYIIVCIFVFSGLSLLYQVNKAFLVQVPDYGGSFTEGIIGSPRFINPVLALSDADRDLTSLVYSGLLKATPEGTLIPDLASGYTISDDGLTYTFTLKDNATFQDGTPVTTDDIVFTIQKAQDPALKSPRRSNWDGIHVNKIDEKTVSFSLKQPYAPFIQNTTIGILPKHIWKNVDNESFPFSTFNTKAVGSGPYKIDSVGFDSSGLPTTYTLTPFKKYLQGRAYISTITFKSYANEEELLQAFQNGDVDSVSGISAEHVAKLNSKEVTLNQTTLPRIFGLFFNQNQAKIFGFKEVRQALDLSINRNEIVETVLYNYGSQIHSPLGTGEHTQLITPDIEQARALLEKNGWKKNGAGIYEKKDKGQTYTLSFSISTGDIPELKNTALLLQKYFQNLGANVEVKIFEIGDLNQNTIRPRKYDALLFGTIIGRDKDLYPFWHSSQRSDPGLNISLYANSQVDKILETYRKTNDEQKKEDLLDQAEKEIVTDTPALFIYSPDFIYITPTRIHNINIQTLTVSADRFLDISKWYIETNNIWKIFNKQTINI